MSKPQIAIDRKWEAENDARTLAEAMAIKKDKPRLSKAAKAAKSMAEEEMVKAKALKQVAKRK